MALICLSKFDEAIAVVTGRFAASLSFERAYCMYQLGHLDDASAVAAGAGGGASIQTLEAQVMYRLGQAPGTADMYQQLAGDAGGGDEGGSEVVSRAVTACAASSWGAEGLDKLGGRLVV